LQIPYKSFGRDGVLGAYFVEGTLFWSYGEFFKKYEPDYASLSKAYFVKEGQKVNMPRKGTKIGIRDNRIFMLDKDANLDQFRKQSLRYLQRTIEEELIASRYELRAKNSPIRSKIASLRDFQTRENNFQKIDGTLPKGDALTIRRLRVQHRRPDRLPFNLQAVRATTAAQFESDFGIKIQEIKAGTTIRTKRLLACSVANALNSGHLNVTGIVGALKENQILKMRIVVVKNTRALFTNNHENTLRYLKERSPEQAAALPEGVYFGVSSEVDLPQGTKFKVLGARANEIMLKTLP